ncbi:GNAT family N-acetyltransferase [Arsenicicoccus dermatophilus]|uniref:GNAT family N-acetyltransferase n=1 Tax=Arsenicicoccus dermatophilus TaxID=1076331 RepID=UPI001F4C7165|nr:GNAT family N-acetyltransferase [Arsenicicoccus dermatophilus]
MNVRRATPADIPEIVRLKAQLMATGWPWPVDVHGDPQWRERCAAAAQTLLDSPSYAAFVVARDDETPGAPLAGMVSVSVEQHLPGPDGPGLSAYVADMSTDPDLRGRGIGTRLLDAALVWAREHGAGWVQLYATESGRGVYERAGFSPDGPFLHMTRSAD